MPGAPRGLAEHRLRVDSKSLTEGDMVAPATLKYLKWSKTPITFDHSDHPPRVATPGRQALVVDPVVGALD